ncbi:hypothetical protein JOB18_043561 [Solea senegalensis]|uniref:PGC-1 and ERR-induced regulator in muscle protein 1 n=1 Tax=Solea senegalensis TaxID=28829 RepID=A0AAV6QN54_SOLSE|nr:uncharacterized protein LOC122768180 [Solea senegalensis]KAG7495071.1 hypothetical protein JOB18_043561 [Solea senegalensis]
MDDLDHSMRIAEFDWSSFYDESEECVSLQPALACPDDLSDSDESLNSSSVSGSSQQETQQNAEVDSDVTESNSAGCNCTESSLKLGESGAHVTGATQVDCPAGNTLGTKEAHLKNVEEVTEDRSDNMNTLGAECSEASITRDNVQQENAKYEPNPLHVKEPHTTEGAVSDSGSHVPARAEKERWFVTVDYTPVRPRARAPTVKKKRRQKKTCKISHTRCHRQEMSPEEEEDTAGGRDTERVRFTESNPDLSHTSGWRQSADTNPDSCEEDTVSESSVHFSKENLSATQADKNIPKPGRSASTTTSHDTFTSKALSRAQSAESDEFSSIHSCDSESYLTAAESAEEALHLLTGESLQPVDVMQLSERQMHSFHRDLSHVVAAVNRDSDECTVDARRALTFPSAGQRANEMPDDNSTCDINTHGVGPRVRSDAPGVQKHDINPASCGSSSGDQLSPVPDLIVTPCPVADSPETYARPVFAISAFWNEMEKVTINDILQLRMSRDTPPRGTDQTVTENVDEIRHSPLVDRGLVELSDAADSDYFTQPDESKPERSSCECFSTSDFEEEEEEYWQFVGTSGNSTPDPLGKSQERTSDSSLLSYEEEDESMSSEGTQTPVPLENFACFQGQGLAWPGQMTKSKSMHNVQALIKEDATDPLGNDESTVLRDKNCPETLAPALFLSRYDPDVLDEHFPEVLEYFFTEDKTNNNESGCITVYNPDELSVAPVFDYSLCPLRDDVPPLSFLLDSLCSDDKPIPIFSCCPPTIREITLPKPDYVFLRTEEEEGVVMDDFSPIRVVSCCFVQADQCGTRATAAGGSYSWKTVLNMREFGLRGRGSIWGRTSGTWMFPPDSEKLEGKVLALTVQPSILETKKTARQEGIFSTLKQSDMCLVCIAFASWVLRSSDPENADTWKAALLANVSALSAIQYLRHYVKRRPRQDDP